METAARALVDGHPAVDEVLVFARKKGFREFLRFLAEVRARRFPLVLDLQRHLKSGVVSMFSGAARRVGFHRRNAREFNWLFNTEYIPPFPHLSSKLLQFQAFGDHLGVAGVKELDFALQPTAALIEHVEGLISREAVGIPVEKNQPDKRLAFILGSSWPSRFWSVKSYAAVARSAWERWGLLPLLIGGEGEKKFSLLLREELADLPLVDLVNKTTLWDLTAIFSRSRAAIAADSGPMHIAAAVGLPVISLWGPTSPLRSAPWRSEHLVLQTPIGCSPCYRRRCPGLDMLCMMSIPVEAVLAQLECIQKNL